MAVFAESVLPSGRGIRLEKLNTRQFKAAQSRANSADSMSLASELLVTSLRGITAYVLEWKEDENHNIDVDAMLRDLPPEQWIQPTYEELVVKDGSRSMETLLEDPTDYMAALKLVSDVTFPNRDRAGSLVGKLKMTSS